VKTTNSYKYYDISSSIYNFLYKTGSQMEQVLVHLKMQERSMAWLSRQLGVSSQTITNWNKGHTVPSRANKIAMAQILGASYYDLFNE